jgi:hypothetical protein
MKYGNGDYDDDDDDDNDDNDSTHRHGQIALNKHKRQMVYMHT